MGFPKPWGDKTKKVYESIDLPNITLAGLNTIEPSQHDDYFILD